METFPALLALCARNSSVTGEFPPQRPVVRNFGVFSDLRMNKRLSNQKSWGWWFKTPSRSLWRQKGPVTQKMFPFDDVVMWHICVHFLIASGGQFGIREHKASGLVSDMDVGAQDGRNGLGHWVIGNAIQREPIDHLTSKPDSWSCHLNYKTLSLYNCFSDITLKWHTSNLMMTFCWFTNNHRDNYPIIKG